MERVEGSSVVLNSIGKGEGSIGAGSLLAHSVLTGHWRIGDGSLVSGIRGGALHVGPGVYVHELELGRHVRTTPVNRQPQPPPTVANQPTNLLARELFAFPGAGWRRRG